MLVSFAICRRRLVSLSRSRARNSSWLGMCVISCIVETNLSAGDPGRCLPADLGRLLFSGLPPAAVSRLLKDVALLVAIAQRLRAIIKNAVPINAPGAE